jgi:hypothetical protein
VIANRPTITEFDFTDRICGTMPGDPLPKESLMKKLILAVLVVACAFTISMGSSAQDAPKTHSMTGCLKAGDAPDSYQLTDLEKGPKSVGIVSSDVKLAPHVGHKIEITGTAVPPADAEAMKGVPKAPHYMKVTAIKMVSTTCP